MLFRRMVLSSALALSAATAASADDFELLARHGRDGGKIDGTGIALRLPTAWSRDWGDWKFGLRPELEVNRFHYTGSAPVAGPDRLVEGAASALLRLYRSEGRIRPYVEVGLGGAALSHDRLAGKEFSTRLQFTERIGAGFEFAAGWFVGWQYAHYSNASIKTPNDGIDFQQILIGVRF